MFRGIVKTYKLFGNDLFLVILHYSQNMSALRMQAFLVAFANFLFLAFAIIFKMGKDGLIISHFMVFCPTQMYAMIALRLTLRKPNYILYWLLIQLCWILFGSAGCLLYGVLTMPMDGTVDWKEYSCVAMSVISSIAFGLASFISMKNLKQQRNARKQRKLILLVALHKVNHRKYVINHS